MSTLEGPNLERLYSINVDGSHNTVHPADVKGRFVTRRRAVFFLLVIIYLALPVVKLGGHPAMHLDIADRRFYLFGAAYNSQDVWLVAFLALGAGFGLLLITAWLGRVWCGWACPQTVFLEGIYRPIERFFEGSRIERLRLAQAPLTLHKLARKVGKHMAFLAVSLFVAHVTLSLFVSGRSMLEMIRRSPAEHWEAFVWTTAIAAGFYFNFAWFREQFCIVLCPYGRLQSALVDRDSLIIGYDKRRGEPRAKRGHKGGDCIDCRRCVVVCPTGIDIRDGLQMECLGCTQCIDACDEIMDKVTRPRGLIRYDSLRGLEGEPRRTARPRLYLYGAIVVAALAAATAGTLLRTPFEANLIRDRGAPWVLDGALIRNQYELHLVNKNPTETTFQVSVVTPIPTDVVVPHTQLRLAPFESARVPVFVSLPHSAYQAPFDVLVRVTESTAAVHREAHARFLGPAPGH